MTDIAELNAGGFPVKNASYWKRQYELLRQQLATAIKAHDEWVVLANQQLAECQARETSLRDDMKLASVQYMGCGGNLLPGEIVAAMTSILNRAMALPSDSTALDTLKKQWQREALLEAADWCVNKQKQLRLELERDYLIGVSIVEDELRRMAKELE